MSRLAVLLVAVLAAPALAQPKISGEDQQFLDGVNRPVVLPAPRADAVRVERDLVYGASGQKADVYLPVRRGGGGVVIFIHGGMGPEFPVRPKEWGVYKSWGRLVAAAGMAAVVFNHRAGFPKVELAAATADLRDVIAFVRGRARGWGVDGERICLAAYSGGGPLLSFALREGPPFLRCQVGVYPIVDLDAELFQSQMTAEERSKYSPLEQLAKNPAMPTMILRAGKDSIPGLLKGLDRFVATALEKNAALTLVNVPDAPHGFDNSLDTPRAREALRAMLGFLDAYVGAR